MNIALTGANHADAHAEREKKLEEILKMYIRHIKGTGFAVQNSATRLLPVNDIFLL